MRRRRRRDEKVAVVIYQLLRKQLADEHTDVHISLLKHRMRVLLQADHWALRCDCGKYGIPPGRQILLDDTDVHRADLCQPSMEAIR